MDSTTSVRDLPPGQRERADFPRFGMTRFAHRFPAEWLGRRVRLGGDGLREAAVIDDATAGLRAATLVADLHCVTTWSRRGLAWRGVRFADWYALHVEPRLAETPGADWVVLLHGQDGWQTTLPLVDALASEALLASELDGAPLGIDHGVPLRFVMPACYGYKSVKHLDAIEIRRRAPQPRSATARFFDHPRARVREEERVQGLPGWAMRWFGRLVIGRTVRTFAAANAVRPPAPAGSSRG